MQLRVPLICQGNPDDFLAYPSRLWTGFCRELPTFLQLRLKVRRRRDSVRGVIDFTMAGRSKLKDSEYAKFFARERSIGRSTCEEIQVKSVGAAGPGGQARMRFNLPYRRAAPTGPLHCQFAVVPAVVLPSCLCITQPGSRRQGSLRPRRGGRVMGSIADRQAAGIKGLRGLWFVQPSKLLTKSKEAYWQSIISPRLANQLLGVSLPSFPAVYWHLSTA